MSTEREHYLANRFTEKARRVKELESQLEIERALTNWLVDRYGPQVDEQYDMFKEFYDEYLRRESK